MYFVAMTLPLRPQTPRASLKITDGVYAHAAVHHAISAVDADLGRALHDMHRHKRMSVALVGPGQTTRLRLTFMAPDGLRYANALVNALSARPALCLGQTLCDVGPADLTSSDWAGVGTWADLMPESVGRHMRLAFLTPTAITKRDAQGGRFTALYPEPSAVFAGLARRWQSLAGPELPADLEQFVHGGGCVIAGHRLRTVQFRTTERTQIGFTGWTVYECRQDSAAHAAALNALVRLAFFAGIGYQTARGMGAVQVRISD
ncbi:MAG: CRISPR system precrRNA processing endoribonuclease RAMP protein Cas6 [Chloroflexi bacterium]|nr:CRISPR system precrRNA processing endoribonuclease RAMP protein Cas6 [Chloroflexota bacterium]MBU1750429.1 CRISPR system precrRNA processing endoribonuclease RAMP protein Cas6 [Chloroflexota bacterium]